MTTGGPARRVLRARVRDADGVHQVMNGIIAEGGPRNGIDEVVTPDSVARWLRELGERGAVFLARVDGRAAAASALEPTGEPDAARLRVWVLASHRRTGLGTELAQIALEFGRARGYKRAVGHVPSDNEPALSFFSSIAGLANLHPDSLRFELPL